MLEEFGIGYGSFQENSKRGVIGKLDSQDQGEEGNDDVEEGHVEKVDAVEQEKVQAMEPELVEIEPELDHDIARRHMMTRKKKHHAFVQAMIDKCVDHSSVSYSWVGPTTAVLKWKPPVHEHLEPAEYLVEYYVRPRSTEIQ